MAYENKNSIEYRVKSGELPDPQKVIKYYIEEEHSYNESMGHFKMSKSTWENYTKRYNIKKGTSPMALQKNKEKIEEEIQTSLEQKAETKDEGINNKSTEETSQTTVSEVDQKKRFNKIREECSNTLDAMFQFCFEFNYFYNDEILRNMLNDGTSDENLPESYVWKLKEDKNYESKTFFSQIKRENFEKIYSEDLVLLALSEEDKKNRQQVISIIGYDPFVEDSSEDRPQLYRDLTDLLTESMRKDAAKKKAAVEIVHNYLNISKYQKRAKALMDSGLADEDTQKTINNYLSMIAKIQASINQTTKENGFSGGRSIGSNGHGMLSDVMNQVEEQGYDPGITNFYDIATSQAITTVATISSKAMLNQVQFSKTDYADIIAQQCSLVMDAQAKARAAQEALRLAKEKITKQELLKELESEYRKKRIDEEEIEEFIKREYKMYEVE